MSDLLKQRIGSAIVGVNEELLDSALHHAIYVERLKTHEVNEIIGLINRDVLPDTLKKLENRLQVITAKGYDPGPVTTKRLRNAIGSANETLKGGLERAGKTLKTDLNDFAIHEAEWQTRVLGKSMPMLNVPWNTPSMRQLSTIVSSRPMEGRLIFHDQTRKGMESWWTRLTKSAQADLSQQLQIGVAQGESVPNLVRRLAGTKAGKYMNGAFGKLRRNVEATVRTSVNHVNTQAREMTYAANDDVISKVQYVATLDHRTTEVCMSLDGQTFKIGEGPRPPLHHRCRSTTCPVTKTWKELGIDLKEPPPGKRAARIYDAEGKALMSGKVPAKTTYPQWLKKQPVAVQDMALGKTRGRLFREGKITVDKFVDSRFNKMSLKEIRAKEGFTKEWKKKPKTKLKSTSGISPVLSQPRVTFQGLTQEQVKTIKEHNVTNLHTKVTKHKNPTSQDIGDRFRYIKSAETHVSLNLIDDLQEHGWRPIHIEQAETGSVYCTLTNKKMKKSISIRIADHPVMTSRLQELKTLQKDGFLPSNIDFSVECLKKRKRFGSKWNTKVSEKYLSKHRNVILVEAKLKESAHPINVLDQNIKRYENVIERNTAGLKYPKRPEMVARLQNEIKEAKIELTKIRKEKQKILLETKTGGKPRA